MARKVAPPTPHRYRRAVPSLSRPLLLLLALRGAAAAAAPSFDPAALRPYFTDGEAKEARRRFQVEDWPAAAAGFDAYGKSHPKAADRLQARFLAAWAHSKAGRFPEAAKRFAALGRDYPLLADHHHLHAARAFAAAQQPAAALAEAAQVEATSPLDGEARLVRAEAQAALGRLDEAAALFGGYLEAYPKSWREAEVRCRFAETSEGRDFAAARAAYRAVYVRFPTESWARRAEARLREREPAALELTAGERLERGLALFEAMRNLEAEAELAKALGGLEGKAACVAAYHLAQSVFKARDRPRAAPLFDQAAARCSTVSGDREAEDLHAKALYQGGRCYGARGETEAAVERFARVEADHPSHSYADDARLRQAETWEAAARRAPSPRGAASTDGGAPLDGTARSKLLLAELVERYPQGDQRGEALFRLFFAAWKEGRLDEAKGFLDLAESKLGREEGWWEAGRTPYYLAHIAERQGRLEAARQTYARCAREYPLSYYALLALLRLRAVDAEGAAKLIAELRGGPSSAAEAEFRFAARPLFEQAGFRRGLELARLGLGAEARRELAAVGLRSPDKGARVEGATEESLWIAAVLFDRAGEYALSHRIPRYHLTSYARSWPTGAERKRWLLAYPRGYADLVVENTRKNPHPEALQFAIIREESAFDPLTESFANAVGLTQLTQAPAKRFAQGLPSSREALRDPAINVAIGARELGHLWSYYQGHGALAIAGYNAGEGAVNRWLRAAPEGQPLDELIESIPYDETRGYTKRVLGSWFAYQWLYGEGDPVPPLPFEVPRRR